MAPQRESAPTTGTLFDLEDPFKGFDYSDFPSDFVEFHQANPQVYRALRDLAVQARNAGQDKLGMKALYEVARWQLRLDTTTASPQLNNVWTPSYARLLMACEPSLDGAFETRTIRRAA